MLDSLRHLRLSEEEKRQETITAYLDNLLSAKDRERFEKQMAADPALRDEVQAQRNLKYHLNRLPRQTVPRNYTLDPAVYGQPDQTRAPFLYPLLRGATVMAGLLFVITLSFLVLVRSQGAPGLSNLVPAGEFVQELADETIITQAERAVSESAAEEMPAEAEIEEAPATILESEVVVEEIVEGEAIEEQEVAAPIPEAEEPLEEAAAAEMVETVEIAAEEIESPVEDSITGGAPAESPLLGESEADRAAAASDGGLLTALPRPTGTATAEMESALPAPPEEESQPTRRADATTSFLIADSAEEMTDEGKAIPPEGPLSDPIRLLPFVVVVLGILVLLLVGVTLLIRRRL